MAAVQEEVWTLSYVLRNLNEVCEAARIRQQQWADAANGNTEPDPALYESDSAECRANADDLAKAISVIERFIVATKLYVPIIDGPE